MLAKITFLIFLVMILVLPAAAQVGVNNPNPEQALDVAGKVKVGNDATTPSDGTIRYNDSETAFEGYAGGEWQSFNKAANPEDAVFYTFYDANLTATGEWEILSGTQGRRVNQDGVEVTQDANFIIPDGKQFAVDQIEVVARDGVANEFFYVGVAATNAAITNDDPTPQNPQLWLSGNSNNGNTVLQANHLPLLVLQPGERLMVQNTAGSETAVRVVMWGALVDDVDEYIGY